MCAYILYILHILYILYVYSVRCNYYIQGLYVNVFFIEKEHASLHVSSRYIEGALLFHADSAMQSCFTIEGAHFQEVCWCPFCTLPALAVANTREKIRLVFLRWVWTAVRVMKIDTAHAIFQG